VAAPGLDRLTGAQLAEVRRAALSIGLALCLPLLNFARPLQAVDAWPLPARPASSAVGERCQALDMDGRQQSPRSCARTLMEAEVGGRRARSGWEMSR
jgi:hypothetical protein